MTSKKKISLFFTDYVIITLIILCIPFLIIGYFHSKKKMKIWEDTIKGIEYIHVVYFHMDYEDKHIDIEDVWLYDDELNKKILDYILNAKGEETFSAGGSDLIIHLRLYNSEDIYTELDIKKKDLYSPVSQVDVHNSIRGPGSPPTSYDTETVELLINEILTIYNRFHYRKIPLYNYNISESTSPPL